MEAVIIAIDSVLAAIGFVCICKTADTDEKTISRALRKIVLPGALAGGAASLLIFPPAGLLNAALGALSGILTAEVTALALRLIEQMRQEEPVAFYDDGTPAKYFITGDKHRNFAAVKKFCKAAGTRRKDVLIILGDAGFNYYGDERDDKLKKEVSSLNITLFCIHGNKENRPQNVGTYGIRSFCGGRVYYEPKYPNIYFAIDGEIYTFEGRKYLAVGGAHSVDKMRCIEENKPFFADEMPDDEVKARVEKRLAEEKQSIYGMMTHTCPIDYLPTEMFMSTKQNAAIKRKPKKAKSKKLFKPDIDRSTEEWLGKLEKSLDYEIWYCGHYHIDKQLDKVNMMCNEIRPLHLQEMNKTVNPQLKM